MFQNEIRDTVDGLDDAQIRQLTRFAINKLFHEVNYEKHFVTLAITDGVIPHDKVESVINPKTSENHQLAYLKKPIDVKEHHKHVKAGEKGRVHHA